MFLADEARGNCFIQIKAKVAKLLFVYYILHFVLSIWVVLCKPYTMTREMNVAATNSRLGNFKVPLTGFNISAFSPSNSSESEAVIWVMWISFMISLRVVLN